MKKRKKIPRRSPDEPERSRRAELQHRLELVEQELGVTWSPTLLAERLKRAEAEQAAKRKTA